MNFYANKLALCSVASFGLTLLVACGDSNTTEVTEQTGMDVVAKGEKLPDCAKNNAGDMLYVADSAAVYYCADGKWTTLKGEKGEKGETGAEGKATNGTSCTAEKTDEGIAVNCDGKPVGTLTNGTGSDGKSAYEVAKANGYKGTETEWLASLKGESCTAEKKDDGCIEVSCNGELVGTLTNGKSAYDLAKENDESIGGVSAWLKSLKGDPGESCTIGDYTDEATGKTGYEVKCDGETKYIWNGTDGKTGAGCTIDESEGNGKVVVTCGEGDDAKPVTLFKATCGSEPYDPETQYCHILNEKMKIEELLIDTRDESNVQKYKTVEICDSKNENCQIWMAQNLNYNAPSSKCGGERGSEERDCDKYGRLYAWVTVIDKSECVEGVYCENKNEGVQGVCPDGWHVPSKPEWETLFSNVGGSGTAGLKLKSVDGWKNYTDEGVERSGNGIDAYGFTVIPVSGGSIIDLLTTVAIFWTSSEMDGSYAYLVDFDPDEKASVSKCAKNGHYGTVRCIKGAAPAASN